ncbi:histidine phosphatase family protein [Nocardioides pacificus]
MSPRPGRRLVLVRHGRTAWNAESRVQGQTDVELDETGHAQAAAAASYLASFAPAALWSSDLARARQTTAYVAKETGLDPVLDERLREFHLGIRQGTTNADYAAQHPQEHAVFRTGRYDVVPGAEQRSAVVVRMRAAIDDLISSAAPGATAMAVSHGAATKVTVVAMLGLEDGHAAALSGLDNCAAAVLEETAYGERWRLAGYNLGAPSAR